MKKRLIGAVSVLVASVIVLSACAPTAQPPAAPAATPAPAQATPAPAAQEPETPVRDELMIVMGAMPITLDTTLSNDIPSAQIRHMIFDPLIRLDPSDMSLIPWIATDWDMPDGYTLNLQLRDDVYFTNGDPLTARDVQFTFERLVEAPVTRALFEMIESVEIHNDHNITMHLNEPFVPILFQLSMNQAGIVSERAVLEFGDDFPNNPVGSGMFMYDHTVLGDRVVLARNDNFWGDAPAIREMTFRVVPEMANRFIEVETGAADIALAISHTDINRAEATDSVVLHRRINFSNNFIMLNTQRPPFDDVRVRHAINHALDIEAIAAIAFGGTGAVSTGPLTPLHLHYIDVEPFEFNVELARELMAEAGFPNGFSTTIWSNAGNQQRADVAEMVQNQLREIDIDVSVEIIEWATYLELTGAGEHYMCILGWVGGNTDPNTGLFMTYHSSNAGSPGNRSFYHNPEVDRLLMEGRGAVDYAERAEIYAEVQRLIRDDAPMVFLHVGEEIALSSPYVRGFAPAPTQLPWFWEVYFE